jgi:hypothetical protein
MEELVKGGDVSEAGALMDQLLEQQQEPLGTNHTFTFYPR